LTLADLTPDFDPAFRNRPRSRCPPVYCSNRYFLRNYRPIRYLSMSKRNIICIPVYRISSYTPLISPWVNTIAWNTTKYLPSSGICSPYADFTTYLLAAKENNKAQYVCSNRHLFEVHTRLTSTYSITSLKNSDY
jgi:hypothetical protein